jgi:hypothetical protein
MKQLQPFEFTPALQPVPENPITFQLKPLDFKGQYIMQIARAETESGLPGFTGLKAAVDYVISWKGGGIEEASEEDARKVLRKVLTGGTDIKWVAWLTSIMNRLLSESEVSESDAKKS